MPARDSARRIASAAPRPPGSGADMWWASAVSPQPARRTGPASRPMRNSAAPSPILMPARLTDIGLQRSAEIASSAEKPASVKPDNASTPPAITASTAPARSRRAPVASAFADDEHAVEIVYAGPRTPSCWATHCAPLPISCSV